MTTCLSDETSDKFMFPVLCLLENCRTGKGAGFSFNIGLVLQSHTKAATRYAVVLNHGAHPYILLVAIMARIDPVNKHFRETMHNSTTSTCYWWHHQALPLAQN